MNGAWFYQALVHFHLIASLPSSRNSQSISNEIDTSSSIPSPMSPLERQIISNERFSKLGSTSPPRSSPLRTKRPFVPPALLRSVQVATVPTVPPVATAMTTARRTAAPLATSVPSSLVSDGVLPESKLSSALCGSLGKQRGREERKSEDTYYPLRWAPSFHPVYFVGVGIDIVGFGNFFRVLDRSGH